MEDQQPQYFDATAAPAPTPAPWWKTWRIALPIAGAAIVVLVAIFVVNSLRRGDDTSVRADSLSRMEQELAACDDTRDPEACKARARNDAAQNGAGQGACDGLDEDAYASCVSLSAKSSADVDACVSLAGEERTSCEDLAYFEQGQKDVDQDICEKIVDRGLRTSCVMRVVEDAVGANNCAAANVDEALCTAAAAMRDAITSGDGARCVALSSSGARTECEDGIASVDADGDGLVVKDEFAAGTSDNNADTDGDGYTDKEEIENGHDPLS